MNVEHVQSSLSLEVLWQFSLQYYSVNEIKEACLTIQNDYGGNVNLAILLCWLDMQKLSFKGSEWDKLHNSLSTSEALLDEYRLLRKELKMHLTSSLYRKALKFELKLEKQQQSDLVECIHSMELTPSNQEPLLLQYCHSLGAINLYPSFCPSKIAQ